MAVARNRLTARGVASLTLPGRHADGGNLYLNVTPKGAKSWVFLYTLAGRQREMGLGSVTDISLADARAKATDCRREIAEGRDPLNRREKVTGVTFGQVADDYIEAKRPGWRNAKHAAQWTMTLKEYAKPLRDLPVNAVDTDAVLKVLKPIWSTKPETASRVRGRIASVLDAAKAKGLRTGDNPARWRWHLDQLLPKRHAMTLRNLAALPYPDLPAMMERLRQAEGISARALEFTILTAARSGETIGATWDEIDMAAGAWLIPPERMKAGKQHRVPLTRRTLEILATMRDGRQSQFIFPGGKQDKPLSVMAMAMALRRLKVDVTVHGFRSTFRDWAAEETDFTFDLAEMSLAHSVGNRVERAYRRSDLFEKRRELMDAWAAYCETKAVKSSDGAMSPS